MKSSIVIFKPCILIVTKPFIITTIHFEKIWWHNNDVKQKLYFYLLCKSLLVSKSMIRKEAFIRCFASYLLEDALAKFHWV